MKEYVNTIKLGAKLEELRIKKGFSQEYVAKKLGISQSKLSRIEKAKNAYIDEQTMHDLAFLYNVTIEEIYSVRQASEDESAPFIYVDPDNNTIKLGITEEANEPEKQESEPKTPARKVGKTNEILALLSMLMGRPESEIIDEAVLEYAEEINFKTWIRWRFMQEE